ncbi:Gfo/Idh/MocA family protein, partial [Thermus scotoductus]
GGPAGVVGDLGAHLFDLVAWLMGGRLEAVFADTARFFPERENPDWAVVSARLGKARGGLELSRVHPVRPQRLFLEIEGTLGILRVEPAFWGPAEGARVFFSSRPGTWAPVPLDPGLLRGRDPKETFGVFHFHELARRFLRAVKTGEAPSPSLLEGVRAQAAIEAVLASAKQKNWQEVPYV